MADENGLKTSNATGLSGTESPVKSPVAVPVLSAEQTDALMDAIHLVQRHLRSEWIAEGCKGERVMGCASCTMTRLHEDLAMLIYEIENTLLAA